MVGKILLVYLALIIYFVMDSISSQIFTHKGYNKLAGALLGLIPIYGLIRALTIKPKKQVQKGYLKTVFKPSALIAKFFIFFEMVGLATLVLLPVIYMVGSSLTKTDSLPLNLWPKEIYWGNYKELFTETKFFVWFKNTFIIAFLNMIFGVVFITGAGYVFARFKFKGKKIGLITILVLQVFPSFMGLIAMFTLFETFGLLGRPVALTILYVGGSIPFNVWLIKGYLQQIPRDLDESAMIDGASKIDIFFKIILPLSVPILSFVAVNQFMAPWMDYMLPGYLLNVARPENVGNADAIQEQWTLAVGLFEMIKGTNSNYTQFAAGALIIGLPITVLYVVFQRFLIEGITAGATKG